MNMPEASSDPARVAVQNVNHPGSVRYVDRERYQAMRRAFARILPEGPPGLTGDQIRERVVLHLPRALFEEGPRPAWWAKTVQLDLEAKSVIVRERSRPLRWHRTGSEER